MNTTNEAQGSLLRGKKIMWVEDDRFLGDMIAKKLSHQGASLVYASNGEDALKIILDEKPDIILLDILLPGMDGFELLEKIKETKGFENTPVVLYSNLNQEKDLKRGKKLGAARFLVKSSVILGELVGELEDVVKEYFGEGDPRSIEGE